MSDSWRDINDPGAFYKPEKAGTASKELQGDTAAKAKNDVEVRLSDPQWKEGPDGYKFNKKAKISVAVQYLKETPRTRVGFEVFVETDGNREDLRQKVDGFEKDGRAEAAVTLFYGNAYSQKLNDDPSATCKYIFKATHPTGEKPVESEPLAMPQTATCKLAITSIPEVFAPSVDNCPIKYKIKEGTSPAGAQVTVTINDAAGNRVAGRDGLFVSQTDESTFLWDGKGADGKYPRYTQSPFTVFAEIMGNPASRSDSKQTKIEIQEILIEMGDVDANSRLVVNVPERETEVCASVYMKKTDGGRALTDVPVSVEFSFLNPSGNNAWNAKSYQYTTGNYLGKGNDPNAVYWKSNQAFTSTSPDSFKTKCVVDTPSASGAADRGKAKVFFKPSGVGSDDFKIVARVMSSDGNTELCKKEGNSFTIWRKIKFSLVYTLSGEEYIDAATTHDEIGPAFETIGANGAFVLFEREPVKTLNAAATVKYIGLYDASSPNKQANWPADFLPAKLETSPKTLDPSTTELNDYAYSGADPVALAKKAQAKTAIEAKAQLWFKAVSGDCSTRADAWFSAAGIAVGNSICAVEYYHPKLSDQGEDGKTLFWPEGITINQANPSSGLVQPGHPDDATWRNVQGFNKDNSSVIFKNYGSAARLQIVCRHEIGHGTKSAFERAAFGTGDHSSNGLMTPYGDSNTFSNDDAAKLRGLS